jgi:hypothetical protein
MATVTTSAVFLTHLPLEHVCAHAHTRVGYAHARERQRLAMAIAIMSTIAASIMASSKR